MEVLGRWKLFIRTGRKLPQILRAVKRNRTSYEKLAKLSARKAGVFARRLQKRKKGTGR